MSRPLKFRAWDRTTKTMRRKGFVIDPEGGMPIKYLSDWGHYFEIMQYTGLKDKNGRDIYEGDVVSGLGYQFCVEFGLHNAYELNIIDGFECESCGKAMSWNINEEEAQQGEVIGNIYENPDLLEEK
jgi:uncharacterized phage protein (TIGR01671 family)